LGEALGGLLAHEELHVRADAVLLVDNTEPDAGIARVQIGEHLGQRGAGPRHFPSAARIGVERRGDEDAHQTDAALTE
jgi:hypothetical protein